MFNTVNYTISGAYCLLFPLPLLAFSLFYQLRNFSTLFKLIIIDELGYIPFSKEGAHHLFQFFADCYEKQSIIVTTNLEFAKWTEFLGDPVMTSALLDRFTHHCDIFPIIAESYRFKNRKKS